VLALIASPTGTARVDARTGAAANLLVGRSADTRTGNGLLLGPHGRIEVAERTLELLIAALAVAGIGTVAERVVSGAIARACTAGAVLCRALASGITAIGARAAAIAARTAGAARARTAARRSRAVTRAVATATVGVAV